MMDHQVTVATPSDRPLHEWMADFRPRKKRIALYSHDTMGIGHMRRNLLIAETLARHSSEATILLIAGAREVNAFGVPTRVDFLSLPSLYKQGNGQYQARHLDLSLEELIALRARTIAASLEAFAPHLLIVDKTPRGAVNELDPALRVLRHHGKTRCVLGLRDVLDDPATTRREWDEGGNDEAVRDYYDAVWVYGDPAVYDPVAEYSFATVVATKIRYTGYLDQRQRTHFADIDGAEELLVRLAQFPERLALCMVGGGQDGAQLAETFARVDLPKDMTGVILTGPFMPPEAQKRLDHLVAANRRIRILRFVTDTDLLLERADCVIAMGGYNTVCEVLSYEKPALIVPRVQPRREQLIRAERLRNLGLLDLLHPEDLSPRALTEWLARELPPRRPVQGRIDLNGLANLSHLLDELLDFPPQRGNGLNSERRPPHVIS
jgi:predicted glycosyltransferase